MAPPRPRLGLDVQHDIAWLRTRAHAAAVAFLLVALDIWAGGLLTRLDTWIAALVHLHVPLRLRVEWAGGWFSRPGDEWWLFPVLAGAALAVAQRHGARFGAGLFLWGIVGAGFVKLAKGIVARPRPYDALPGTDVDAFYLAERSASFPSGHSFDSLVLYGLVAACAVWVASPGAQSRVRRIALVAWLALAAVIALARIVAHVHYPGDIVGSWALGVAWLAYGAWWLARTRPDLWLALVGPRVTPENVTPTHK